MLVCNVVIFIIMNISSLRQEYNKFSLIANVLDIEDTGKILKAKICDESAITYVIAWGKEKDKINFKKKDTIKINNGLISNDPPSIILTKDSNIERLTSNVELHNEEILKPKFIDEIPEFGYCYIECFIVSIFDIFKYYCNRCKRYTGNFCTVCGNISDKILIIEGLISDSTNTINFVTKNENISEKLLNFQTKTFKDIKTIKKIDNNNEKREIIKEMFRKKYKLFGYKHNGKFFINDL